MDKRQNSTGDEQKRRGGGGRSRVEARIRDNIHIEADTSQSTCGRQSIGRKDSSCANIYNRGQRTTEIDNTASSSHAYNYSKHNDFKNARIKGPVTFEYKTKYCIQKHEGLETVGSLVCQPKEYHEGLSKVAEPYLLSPETPPTNEDSFNEFQLAPELPFPRNQYFCGREDLIDRMHSIFHPAISEANTTALTARLLIALHGLGGIGKTQIALEYAHRYEHLYSAILWVDAKDQTVMESSGVRILQQLVYHYATRCPANPDYTRIANELGIPGGINLSGAIKQDAVNSNLVWRCLKQWLQKKGNVKWLLLVDNHDDLEAMNLFDYLPTANWGRIIVTSRRSEIRFLGYSLPVTEVERDVGRAMLSKVIPDDGKELSVTDIKDADEVVQKLGGLPLAINQAAAYIAMTQIDCKTYLRKLEANFKHIASTRPRISTYGNDSVFTCWEISFAALCPSAAQLLHLCAFLSNEGIPDELFHRGRTGVEWLNNDDDAFDIAIENLLAFSLVKRKATSLCDSFWIHPIVHQWAREHLNVDDQRVNAGNAISLITTAVVTESIHRDREYWEFERRISNHIDLCFQNISKFYRSVGNEYPANILRGVSRLGTIDNLRGRYDHSAQWLQWALDGFEKVLGKHHPDTLTTVHNLACVFEKQGECTKALEWYQRALDGKEEALGKHHLDTLTTVHDLAFLFEKQGEYAKALEWYQRALDGKEKALGKHHPDTLTTVHNLAFLFEKQGEYAKALEWYQRALDGKEKALGKHHPETLTTVHNLAFLFEKQGEYAKALEWYQRALDGKEKALGKCHPSTLTTVSRMASVFESQVEYAKAREWYQRALDGLEKALGKHHRETLITVQNLACLFQKQGEYAKALELYQRALDGHEKALGKHHPETVTTVHNLACLFEKQGEYAKALECHQRALDGKEKALGTHHPETLTAVHNLAFLFEKQEEYAKSLEWYQRALDGFENALGKHHPGVLTTVSRMASVFESQEEYAKALEWYQRALDGYEKTLGRHHLDTLTTVHNLACLFRKQGEYVKALDWYQRALDGVEKALGKHHPDTLTIVHNLACLFQKQGEYAKAFEWYKRAHDGLEKALGKHHPNLLTTAHNIACLCESQGEYAKSLEWYQRAFDGREKALGTHHPRTISSADGLARLRALLGLPVSQTVVEPT